MSIQARASSTGGHMEICSNLQESSQATYHMIGQNDLWIAATAVHFDRPLVTRNRRHFEEIPGLRLQALL